MVAGQDNSPRRSDRCHEIAFGGNLTYVNDQSCNNERVLQGCSQ